MPLRPLTRLRPDLQRQAWWQAVDHAPQGKITAKYVQKVAKQVYHSQFQKSQVQNPPAFPKNRIGDCVQIHLRNRSDRELNQYEGKLVLYQLDFDSGEKNEKLEKNPDVQCQKNILLTSLPRNEKNYIS